MFVKNYLVTLLYIVLTHNIISYGQNITAISPQQIIEDYYRLLYGNKNNLSSIIDDDEEIDEVELWDAQTIHVEIEAQNCGILDDAILFIKKSNDLFIPEEYKLFENPEACLNIDIKTMFDQIENNSIIEISENASYILDIVYNNDVRTIDDYIFFHSNFRFSSSNYIKPWYRDIIKVFTSDDDWFLSEDFFVCWSFEVFCGKIVKAYLIDGWCEYKVFDLITCKEIPMEQYNNNQLFRRKYVGLSHY